MGVTPGRPVAAMGELCHSDGPALVWATSRTGKHHIAGGSWHQSDPKYYTGRFRNRCSSNFPCRPQVSGRERLPCPRYLAPKRVSMGAAILPSLIPYINPVIGVVRLSELDLDGYLKASMPCTLTGCQDSCLRVDAEVLARPPRVRELSRTTKLLRTTTPAAQRDTDYVNSSLSARVCRCRNCSCRSNRMLATPATLPTTLT